MKLISLNIWGGKVFEPLIDFVKQEAGDTDIFCFQEVFSSPVARVSRGTRTNILADLREVLSGFTGYFVPTQDGFDNEGPVDFTISTGLATFMKKSLAVESTEEQLVCGAYNSASGGDPTTQPAGFFCVRCVVNGKKIAVCNFHGTAFPGTKLDTEKRLLQSENIRNFLNRETYAKILCGDFNLLPDTESMRILEKSLTNLIRTFNISQTRSSLSPYYGTPTEQKFADYALVSPDITVKDFRVPDILISDHLPMILEFA